ncbi:MAG: OmpH family outer membrane protein [Saprospiraceae bacterium]
MKNFIKIGGLFIALFCMVSMAQAQKFGYVNSAAILAEMPDVKQADANLEALQKQLQKKGQQMVQTLQTNYQAVQERVAKGELAPKQQEEEGAKLQAEQEKIAKFEQDMVTQISQKRETLLSPILERVNTAIADVAKENGMQFIFDSSSGVLLYADEAQDVGAMVKAKLGI